jgi:hypothetical protein
MEKSTACRRPGANRFAIPDARTIRVRAFVLAAAAFFGAALPPTVAAAAGRHPSYTFTSLLKSDFKPIVGGMDWMPDGKLALVTLLMKSHDHVSGPSDVFLLDGVLKGGAADVTVKKYASGFYTPLGLKVVDGSVYVLDNREGILKLVDADKDGVAEGRSVLWDKGIKATDRKWVGGLAFMDGFFYASIGVWITEGVSGTPQPPLRGTLLKIKQDGSQGDAMLGGLRNPNGVGLGPNGEIFLTDNQGDWLPSSKILHALPGEFYGHAETPFANKPITPPLAWLPHGELSQSPSTPLILEKGPFAGQMLVGEVTLQSIFRGSLEKVGGRLQGCVFRFAWDMPAGVNRLLAAPDGSGSILVGGVGGDGGWTLKEPWYDLERMTPTDSMPFDMLAVRSMGPSKMEIEFTKPLAPEAAVAARFQVNQWRYVPTDAYGGPKVDNATLTVGGVALSADGRKATLDIAGLKTGHVVRIRLSGLKSKSGEAPWGVDAHYTLNAFGPADVPVAIATGAKNPSARARSVPGMRLRGGVMAAEIERARFPEVRSISADGRVLRDFSEKVRP